MYFVGLLIKVGSFLVRERLASYLELARYTTELKPKLSSFKNSNEPSRAEPSRATNERVQASLRASSFLSSPGPGGGSRGGGSSGGHHRRRCGSHDVVSSLPEDFYKRDVSPFEGMWDEVASGVGFGLGAPAALGGANCSRLGVTTT
jgi:hypothetical protein